MRLTCAIGWHRASPNARWNQGYYFSSCKGCGRGLVKAAGGRWHVPKGFKIVWKPASAAELAAAEEAGKNDWARWVREQQVTAEAEPAATTHAVDEAPEPLDLMDALPTAEAVEPVVVEPQPAANELQPEAEPVEEPVAEQVSAPTPAAEPIVEARAPAMAAVRESRPEPAPVRRMFMPAPSPPLVPREAPPPRRVAEPAYDDDFMSDDGDWGWASAPLKPIPVRLSDDEDFMGDLDDAFPERDRSIPEAPPPAPRPPLSGTDPDKAKKAKRGRKKAGES